MTNPSKMEVPALSVDIIGTDCTNNGVTSGRNRALVVDLREPLQGPTLITLPYDVNHFTMPVLKLVAGRGTRKVIAVPIDTPDGVYPMFGGHFIHTSDSRFPSDAPIHVHDRFE